MIVDRQILNRLEGVDNQLNVGLQRLLLDDTASRTDEQVLIVQDGLQRVKGIVDGLVRFLRRDSGGTLSLNYREILRILRQVSETAETGHRLDDGGLASLYYNALIRYVVVLCYYTLLSSAATNLPRCYDAIDYYRNISNSTTKSFYYGIQFMIPHLLSQSYHKNKNNKLDVFKLRLDFVLMKNFQFVGMPRDKVDLIKNPLNYIKVLLNLPLSLVQDELSKKLETFDEVTGSETKKLGKLIDDFNSQFSASNDISTHIRAIGDYVEVSGLNSGDINELIDVISAINNNCLKKNNDIRKPGFFNRNWPLITLGLLYGPSSLFALWQARFKIADFIQHNVVDFITGLVYNWVYTPMKQVWATVRHDEGSSISVTSQGSLESEMSSLSRMIVSFVVDNSDNKQAINEAQLVTDVEHGDLTQFLTIYENQLHHPIKNIVSGSLIRSLLIQVQKTKVDGSLALNGIDKMLKSQQLVFGVLAVSPALVIIYTLFVALKRFIKLGSVYSSVQKFKHRISVSLNNVERIINDFKDNELKGANEYLNEGLLFIEIATLYDLGKRIVPKNRRTEWCRDVQELMTSSKFSRQTHLNVVNRIYHVYGRYI
ncbi:Nuclear control of ATPase protein 2 [Nakaseomyces bracarensis]|uniref:Nuclear control of ATPase protein 2 n=1 Tax=Nakaseomyces bracarensis TaxID=273131 RepID=A0ABR4NZ39_9SACH